MIRLLKGVEHMSIDLSNFTLFKPRKLTKEEGKQIRREIKEMNTKNKQAKASKLSVFIRLDS
jgi:hypothetical protein